MNDSFIAGWHLRSTKIKYTTFGAFFTFISLVFLLTCFIDAVGFIHCSEGGLEEHSSQLGVCGVCVHWTSLMLEMVQLWCLWDTEKKLPSLWRVSPPSFGFYNITVVFVTLLECRSGTAGHSNTQQQPSAPYLSKCQVGLILCPSPPCGPPSPGPRVRWWIWMCVCVLHMCESASSEWHMLDSFYRPSLTFAVISQCFYLFIFSIIIFLSLSFWFIHSVFLYLFYSFFLFAWHHADATVRELVPVLPELFCWCRMLHFGTLVILLVKCHAVSLSVSSVCPLVYLIFCYWLMY